jgi:hypothetical protein
MRGEREERSSKEMKVFRDDERLMEIILGHNYGGSTATRLSFRVGRSRWTVRSEKLSADKSWGANGIGHESLEGQTVW